MHQNLKEIHKIEKSKRVAVSKKYPILLPIILSFKRSINFLFYTYHPTFNFKVKNFEKDFNITEHSSPLYRKYNKRELDEGKVENIKLAIKNINGLVVPPGKTFSFWKQVGKPSKKKGFQKGLVLSNGNLKEDIGGGLCQLSNLLAYMFACTDCKFIERKHHSKDVFPDSGRTVPFASGATVFFNLIDLKIKNTYDFPIKINVRVTETQLRGSISSPYQLNYFIKLKQQHDVFIKSIKTGILYRCNKLIRTYYKKGDKYEFKQVPLWSNTAQVMYEEEKINAEIINF